MLRFTQVRSGAMENNNCLTSQHCERHECWLSRHGCRHVVRRVYHLWATCLGDTCLAPSIRSCNIQHCVAPSYINMISQLHETNNLVSEGEAFPSSRVRNPYRPSSLCCKRMQTSTPQRKEDAHCCTLSHTSRFGVNVQTS